MIVVTHEIEFARDVADKIIFMADGVIAEQGLSLIHIQMCIRDSTYRLRLQKYFPGGYCREKYFFLRET